MLLFLISNWDRVLTIIFAGLGVVFAALSAWLSYLAYKRDRPRVKVTAALSLIGVSEECLIDAIWLEIVNIGRRPINIKNIFIKLKGGKKLMFLSVGVLAQKDFGLPIILGENESHEITFLQEELRMEIGGNNAFATHFCFTDSSGDQHCCKIKKSLGLD